MKNIERQRSLDKKKWYASEKNGLDMGGKMNYCKYCSYTAIDTEYIGKDRCIISQEEKENRCICATAYNRMIRYNKK